MEPKRLLLIEARAQPRALLSRSFENEGFVVTAATGIAEAALRMNPAPNLVVSSFAVSQGDPLDFCHSLKADGRSSIPFLYLYDRRKPLSVNRLRDARVEHAVGTPAFVRDVVLAGRLIAEAKEPTRPSFTGALEQFALPTLLRVGSQPDRSSSISVFSRGDEGVITLRDGFVVGAESKSARATLTGLRAFDRVAQWVSGGFAIELLRDRADGKVLLALPVALQRIVTARSDFANALGDDQTDWVYEADYRVMGSQMSDIPRLAVDVAKLMDGKRTVYEILAESRTDEPTTLRIIRRLAERGVAKRVEASLDALPIEVGPRIGRDAEAPLPAWDEAPATIIAPTPSFFDPALDAPRDFPSPVVKTLGPSPSSIEDSPGDAESASTRIEKSPWSGAPLIPFGDERTGTKRSPTPARHERGSNEATKAAEPIAPFHEGAFSSEEEAFFVNELSTPKLKAVGTWPGVDRALVSIPTPSKPAAAKSASNKPAMGPDFSAPKSARKTAGAANQRDRNLPRGSATSRTTADVTDRSSRPLSNIDATMQARRRVAAASQQLVSAALAPKRRWTWILAVGAVVVGLGLLVYGIVAPSSDQATGGAAAVIAGSERIDVHRAIPRDEVPPPAEEVRAAPPAAPETAAEARREAGDPRKDEAAGARTETAAPAAPAARRDDAAPSATRNETPATDNAAQLRRAERLLGQGRTDSAVRSLRVVLSRDPDHARARVLLARTLYDQGLVPEAEGHVKKGLAVAPRNAELTLLSGVIAQSKGNRPAATVAFERYLKLSPKGRFAGEVREILKGWKR